jgi:hypothetical protein
MFPKVRLTHFQRLTLLAAPVSFGSLADSSPVNSTDRYRQSWAVPNLQGDIACLASHAGATSIRIPGRVQYRASLN